MINGKGLTLAAHVQSSELELLVVAAAGPGAGVGRTEAHRELPQWEESSSWVLGESGHRVRTSLSHLGTSYSQSDLGQHPLLTEATNSQAPSVCSALGWPLTDVTVPLAPSSTV